jgi:hypothetical protein
MSVRLRESNCNNNAVYHTLIIESKRPKEREKKKDVEKERCVYRDLFLTLL